ncbi:MAG: hypothetical protein RQ736_10165 [Thiogranum sp.]|nr:hypothetical protein [Thiogranum sp.]
MQRLFTDFSAGLLAALLCNLVLLGWIGRSPVFGWYQENGLLENIQLLLLLLCGGVLVVQLFFCTESLQRLTVLAALLLVFTFFIRECDLRLYGAAPAVTYFSDGDGRYWLLIPLWLGLGFSIVRDQQAGMRKLWQLLSSRTGVLLLLSAALLAVSVLLDKSVLQMVPSRFYEEWLEVNGYLLLLAAALSLRIRGVFTLTPNSGN